MTLLSSALGLIIRKAIPAAAILLVYLLIVSPLLSGQNWYFLPDIASYSLWFATTPESAPPALVAWLVLLTWTIAFLVVSVVVAKWRDTGQRSVCSPLEMPDQGLIWTDPPVMRIASAHSPVAGLVPRGDPHCRSPRCAAPSRSVRIALA